MWVPRSTTAELLEPRLPQARAGQRGDARAVAFAHRQGQVEPLRRQKRAETLRPFDQADAFGQRLLQPELAQLIGRFDAIEIEMPDRYGGISIVDLDQHEGGARYFDGIEAAGADEGAGEAGLAAAERTRQRDHVALADARGNTGGQAAGF